MNKIIPPKPSTIALTMNTYSHVMPTMQEEAARKIDEVFKNAEK